MLFRYLRPAFRSKQKSNVKANRSRPGFQPRPDLLSIPMKNIRRITAAGIFSLALLAAIAQTAPATAQTASAPMPATVQTTPATAQTAPATAEQLERLVDTGHAAEVLQQLDADVRISSRDRVRGEALYALSRLPEADRAFAAAIVADGKDLSAVQLRGLTLFRLGRPADAIPLLEKAHEWNSATKVDPAYVLALCYIDTRRYDDARHAFAEQYGFAPDSAPAHLLAARMLLRREYVPIAQEEARKALTLDPQLPLAHMLLGEVALAQAHVDEAITELQAEQKRNPLNGAVYDRLGDAYSRKGDYAAAQQVLQRALLLEPNSTGPYILLGKALLKTNDAVSAAGYLERAERMDPSNYMTHNLLGQAYRAMGRTADAQRETQTGQRIQSEAAPKLDSTK